MLKFYFTPTKKKTQSNEMRDNNTRLLVLLSHMMMILVMSQSEFLILPLKTQELTAGVSFPKKLPFRHNVSLTVSLTVGSPPQNVTMVLDTGSELSWLHCNKSQIYPMTFTPNLSASFSPVRCSSPVCTNRTHDLTIPATCDRSGDLCHVMLTYADFSSTEGFLASDTFNLGSSEIPGLVFGCMQTGFSSDTGEDSKTSGLMGMNLGSLSLVSQMSFPKFSYCISGYDISGVLLLGGPTNATSLNLSSPDIAPPLNYTPLVRMSTPLPYFNRVAYTVQLVGIKVGGELVNVSNSVFVPDHTGAGQTMVDSGTQFTFLLGPAYAALREGFLNRTRDVLAVLEEEDFVFQGAMDLCYRVTPEQSSAGGSIPLPEVSLVFDGAEMTVSDESLLYRVPGEFRGNDSVQCFTFGNSDLLGVEAYLIGHHHQQNMWMEFDLEKSRIGIAQTRCDLAVQRLGLNNL